MSYQKKDVFKWIGCIVAILAFIGLILHQANDNLPKSVNEVQIKTPREDIAIQQGSAIIKGIDNGSGNSAERSIRVRPLPIEPPPIDLSAIDAVLEKMHVANIAFNAPKLMNLGSATTIHLVLGVHKTPSELKDLIKSQGEKRGAEIRISDEMEARLTGFNFTIKAMTAEKQAVSQVHNTEWKWEVKPESVGEHQLHLTLSATLFVDGRSMTRSIRTFDETINVEVTWQKQASDFIENNWQWLWVTLLVPLGGWIWAKKKKNEEIGI